MNLVFKPTEDDDDDYRCNDDRPIIHSEYIHFSEPVQNAVMNDSYFIRIVYSNDDVSLAGLMIPMYFSAITVLKLRSCNVKLFDDIDKNLDECNVVLKVSGIWENDKEIGITFKFILLC